MEQYERKETREWRERYREDLMERKEKLTKEEYEIMRLRQNWITYKGLKRRLKEFEEVENLLRAFPED